MRTKATITVLLVALAGAAVLHTDAGQRSRMSKGDYAAYQMLKRGIQLLEAAEEERGVKMLQTVIEQHPKSNIRFQAYLELGKHFLAARDQAKAIPYLQNIKRMDRGNKKLEGDDLELYLEGLYLTGVAHYQQRQYGAAFSSLRIITTNYPDSPWANQAYYYIGMSHFAQSHWNKAIDCLNQVGAFIDADSPTLAYAEAGHRFFVKINDGDLPILNRLGKKITVTIKSASGDTETVPCEPKSSSKDAFIGSVPTQVGKPKPGDNMLQVIGGDKITVEYLDNNTKEGKKDVPRTRTVEVVSTGGITFTLSTFDSLAPAAYIGQPLYVRLWDLDMDKTDDKDAVTIRVSTLYKPEPVEEEAEEGPPMTVDVEKLLEEEKEEEKLAVRDEVTLTLTERGEGKVRTGLFLGSVAVKRAGDAKSIDKTDNILSAEVGDQVVATYVDERHIKGTAPIEVTASLIVAGEIDSTPRAAQDVVTDPIVRARKQLVEAAAYLELAKIFKNMGLMNGARSKAADGLDRVDTVIRERAAIPVKLKERAFQLKWELHLAEDEFGKAMGTCRTFNKLYPESTIVDKALMGIGEVLIEKKEYAQAINVLKQVAGLPNSHSRARAAFMVAEVRERMGEKDAAIREYTSCAKRFPDSEFAGPSLAKVIDFHVKTGALAEADDLLEQVFVDYQDEDFLDSMLLKWVLVAYQNGDYQKAHSKCKQLINEYPGSTQAAKAEKILPKIEKMLGKGGDETKTEGKKEE